MIDLHQLLEATSRTFALNIPFLPSPTRREVTIAYLLFRIADTLEDASTWRIEDRTGSLLEFARLLEDPNPGAAKMLREKWLTMRPTEHEGYRDLLAAMPEVLAELGEVSPPARRVITAHTIRTSLGMAQFLGDAGLGTEMRVRDFADLRQYCYHVAGIVGEMLTELFLLEREELAPLATYLRERSSDFGEGLQLTNILKDAGVDDHEGRHFLPEGVEISRVFEQARHDLRRATEYTCALQEAGAPRGMVSFNALPALLAWHTLDRVETLGAGSKLTRQEVFALMEQMNRALDCGSPALEVPGAKSRPDPTPGIRVGEKG